MGSPPGSLEPLSDKVFEPRSAWELARMTDLLPGGKGPGVVFGRGSDVSALLVRKGGGALRKRVTMDARWRSRTYGDSLVKGSNFARDRVIETGVDDNDPDGRDSAGDEPSELGTGRSKS